MARQIVREIDVRKQESLSFHKCMQLVASGIKHRLMRSLLTTSVILLAVAFFTAMLTENMFLHAVSDGVNGLIAESRAAVKRMNFMYNLPTETEMAAYLAGIPATAPRGGYETEGLDILRENSSVSGWDLERIEKLARNCRREAMYNEFFNKMDIGKRRALVARAQGREVYGFLRPETAWSEFVEKLKPMHSLQIPSLVGDSRQSEFEMREFINEYEKYAEELRFYTADWHKKINAFTAGANRITGGRPLSAWLVSAPKEDTAKWADWAGKCGFVLTPVDLVTIRERFGHLRLREEVVAALTTPAARDAWKKIFNVEKVSLEEKLGKLTHPRVMREILGGAYSEAQLRTVGREFLQEKRQSELARDLSGKLDTKSGSLLSGRQLFLLIISFVVCMVGIANAMLMAITERFREIATLKCLGATDGYILSQFMMEASVQGLVGGSIGMIIGFLLALVKNSLSYGGYLYSFFPIGEVVICGLVSLLAGIILASLASLYPAWSASRMAPMEAMRVE